jgi:hypothetical protein
MYCQRQKTRKTRVMSNDDAGSTLGLEIPLTGREGGQRVGSIGELNAYGLLNDSPVDAYVYRSS